MCFFPGRTGHEGDWRRRGNDTNELKSRVLGLYVKKSAHPLIKSLSPVASILLTLVSRTSSLLQGTRKAPGAEAKAAMSSRGQHRVRRVLGRRSREGDRSQGARAPQSQTPGQRSKRRPSGQPSLESAGPVKHHGPHVTALRRKKPGGGGYVCGLGGGDGFTSKHLTPDSLRHRYSLCMDFICQLYVIN